MKNDLKRYLIDGAIIGALFYTPSFFSEELGYVFATVFLFPILTLISGLGINLPVIEDNFLIKIHIIFIILSAFTGLILGGIFYLIKILLRKVL